MKKLLLTLTLLGSAVAFNASAATQEVHQSHGKWVSATQKAKQKEHELKAKLAAHERGIRNGWSTKEAAEHMQTIQTLLHDANSSCGECANYVREIESRLHEAVARGHHIKGSITSGFAHVAAAPAA